MDATGAARGRADGPRVADEAAAASPRRPHASPTRGTTPRFPWHGSLRESRASVTHKRWPACRRSRARGCGAPERTSSPTSRVRCRRSSACRARARSGWSTAARAALAARCREVNAMTYPNLDEVWWCDLGEGAALGGHRHRARASPDAGDEHRLPAVRQRRADRLRRRDAALPAGEHRHQRLRSVSRQRGGVSSGRRCCARSARSTAAGRFVINAYQFGAGNAEAIAERRVLVLLPAGLPAGARARRTLAAREARRMAADRNYRSDARTLKALATGDLYLDLPGFDPDDYFDEALLPHVGALRGACSWRTCVSGRARTQSSASPTPCGGARDRRSRSMVGARATRIRIPGAGRRRVLARWAAGAPPSVMR